MKKNNETAGAQVLYPEACFEFYHKIHNIDMIEQNCGSAMKIESFDDYDVIIRIKFESVRDCEQALKLAMLKLADRNFYSTVSDYQQYEENFSGLDHKFNKIILFQDLFDITKLKVLFFEYHNRDMTLEEEKRIVDNIKLNLAMLGEN